MMRLESMLRRSSFLVTVVLLGTSCASTQYRSDGCSDARPLPPRPVNIREASPVGLLRGRVVYSEQYRPSFAQIRTSPDTAVVADSLGYFSLPVTAGRLQLLVRRVGFAHRKVTFDIAAGHGYEVEIPLSACPVKLEM